MSESKKVIPIQELAKHKGREILHITLVEEHLGAVDTVEYYEDEWLRVNEHGHLCCEPWSKIMMIYNITSGMYEERRNGRVTEHNFVGYMDDIIFGN